MPSDEESRQTLQLLMDMAHGRCDPPPVTKVPVLRALKMAWIWRRRTGAFDCLWWAITSRSSDMEFWYDDSDLADEPPWPIVEMLGLPYAWLMFCIPLFLADKLHWHGLRLLWIFPIWFVTL